MSTIIDTSVAIHLRDGDAETITRLSRLPGLPKLSIVTRVELEGGVVAKPMLSAFRRQALDTMLRSFDVIDFDNLAADQYRLIVEQSGYVRSRIIDRMIAATALAHGLAIITNNPRDFADVPGLELIGWP